MKVWIVTNEIEFSEFSEIVGVFASAELAQKFIDEQNIWETGYNRNNLYCVGFTVKGIGE